MLKKDILFLLSGGSNNQKPNKSIGGKMSSQVIGDLLNSLFVDITAQQLAAGYTDYHCIYIKNANSTERLTNTDIWIHKELSGAQVQLGINLADEVQALVVKGKPSRGRFQLVYAPDNSTEGVLTRQINWSPDVNLMQNRIQAILASLDGLRNITVNGTENDTGFDFLVNFSGACGSRGQSLLGFANKVDVDVTSMRVLAGGPINTTAPDIGFPKNPPSNVTFFESQGESPIRIGTLQPGDFFPVWLKRTVLKKSSGQLADQFKIGIQGDPE